MCRDIGHYRRDLQHLHRMGQPVMREPQRPEAGITRRAHLHGKFRDAFSQVETFGELRVDEQTDFRVAPLNSPDPALRVGVTIPYRSRSVTTRQSRYRTHGWHSAWATLTAAKRRDDNHGGPTSRALSVKDVGEGNPMKYDIVIVGGGAAG